MGRKGIGKQALIPASLLRTLLTWLGRKRLPQISGSLKAAGLLQGVEVIRDRWGMPHIYAANLHDLFFAQGFVHAQDRLWQMELNRRAATGRLSEMLGVAGLETDRATRTFGFHRLAEADWTSAPEDLRAAVLAYSEGINAYLSNSSAHRPLEFTLLHHHPQPWRPEDTMAVLRLMIWQFTFGWIGKLLRAGVTEVLGAEGMVQVDVRSRPGSLLTLPRGIELNRAALTGSLRGVGDPFITQGMGSNAWALCGQKTTTGKPFLCNDMHVPPPLPSLWYEVHLVGGGLNVIGASVPGAPMVTVGHNARLAWGFTMAMADSDDLYIERFHPQEPGRYQFCGEWLDAEVIPETIRIKGRAKPHIEQVTITRHGPIISEVIGSPDQRLAVRSMALQPCQALRGWLLLNQAGGWEEFVEAVRQIEAPHLNVLYADVEGNIGYWLTGKVPLRAKRQGMLPVLGWSGECEWIGEIPFAEMPHALNPEQGYALSCNNRIVPEDYPYFLGNLWANGYRACRARDLLAGKERLSTADFATMQQDLFCIPGCAFVERLHGLPEDDPDVRLALNILRAWDGRLETTSVGGALYQVAKYTLVHNLLEPKLGKALTNRLAGHGHDSTLALRLLDDLASRQVLLLIDRVGVQGTAPLVKQNLSTEWLAQAGGREAALTLSLKQAIRWLRQELGPNVSAWRWGRLHPLTFAHVMGQHPPLDQVFNLGPYPFGGDADTLCQTAVTPGDPFESKEVAPTYRQIVDLGDLKHSLSIHAPGQSGQLGSPHYGDLAEKWLKGEYHPMLWERADIEREAEGTLRLDP